MTNELLAINFASVQEEYYADNTLTHYNILWAWHVPANHATRKRPNDMIVIHTSVGQCTIGCLSGDLLGKLANGPIW